MGLLKIGFVALTVLVVAAAAYVGVVQTGSLILEATDTAYPAPGGTFRDYELEIVPTDFDTGAGAWHAWTYNGQVPGPTLTANVGDVLRVTVTNKHNLTHSFHTHLVPASLASDGAQLNTITGIGAMAMLPPGGTYTYTLTASVAGLFYYHCHSADGGHTISQHMAQGLYGAILIKDPEEDPIRTEVVFMGERGFDVDDPKAPYFVMNGKGLPGGEHELERVFVEQGVPGVVAQLGHTVPVFRGRVGEEIEIAVINIGDAVHSFHLHGMIAYSQEQQPGKPVPAQVVQLVPGAVDRIRLTPTVSGLWLFHCHVVTHADQGMIGVFLVDPAEGELDLPDPAPSGAPPHGSHGAPDPYAGTTPTPLTIVAGADGDELAFSWPEEALAPGRYEITLVNEGKAPHSLRFPGLGVGTTTVPGGASATLTVTLAKPGEYAFICNEPGHASAGMKGSLRVA